jgi:preprotein translocase subunit SecG
LLALISTIHIVTCLFLILVVLLQQGKGADLSVFGGGGTQAAFGARGATTLLHKLTVIGFVGFIVTTMVIGMIKTSERTSSVITDVPAATAPAVTPEAVDEAAGAMEEATGAVAGDAEAATGAAVDADAPADASAAEASGEDADGGTN